MILCSRNAALYIFNYRCMVASHYILSCLMVIQIEAIDRGDAQRPHVIATMLHGNVESFELSHYANRIRINGDVRVKGDRLIRVPGK